MLSHNDKYTGMNDQPLEYLTANGWVAGLHKGMQQCCQPESAGHPLKKVYVTMGCTVSLGVTFSVYLDGA